MIDEKRGERHPDFFKSPEELAREAGKLEDEGVPNGPLDYERASADELLAAAESAARAEKVEQYREYRRAVESGDIQVSLPSKEDLEGLLAGELSPELRSKVEEDLEIHRIAAEERARAAAEKASDA
ncbi:MAG: hypothetical protein COV59_00620 [Candidatus Magasanikbacteria bacterium CG11_big_fil_rev_8_21_14_0_20_39_34]|uniref:Uncharacterized protein n=1 Tax=Candidatus Magasanikbacteria bacterium CG11_big_fil_rev_8_21_14_0_20_39_34 TaxID=1974653 RepID=A0A2H0N6F9_9BACT|nr:MAG: hypothetical protein COV59_00620 [Candidatus Magasanikbacteria bacterium CG11_big_fil_rev_8_21_14_0_20_39_34]